MRALSGARLGQWHNRKKVMRLEAGEFIGRFLLHILPGGFKRIRHYGLLGAGHKAANLAAARVALEVPAPDPLVVGVGGGVHAAGGGHRVAQHCPCCREGRFRVLQGISPLGVKKAVFSVTACSPSETIMNIFCIYARFNRRLCGLNSRGFARPCNMNSPLTGQFVRRLGVGASHKSSPGYPFHLHPLPPPQDIGLTPHFKTLQSP